MTMHSCRGSGCLIRSRVEESKPTYICKNEPEERVASKSSLRWPLAFLLSSLAGSLRFEKLFVSKV